ncbi:unnamed protein product [Polarella glacialis]|uniref:Glycosyltransferase 61 catalytic domain-containing protein n=1 Tax=Polarella glacialis TaxID=89957 RepID=A0A813HBM1_POLGL|nr:unnamed protein product [Polarella glacialis]
MNPANLFHFAQLVLPAFAARVRLSWADGTGVGPLGRLPRLDPVVLHDHSGVSRLSWQHGLLQLVTGGARTVVIRDQLPGYSSNSNKHKNNNNNMKYRCFHRAILPGLALRSHATTGSLDHAALLVQAAHQVPDFEVLRKDVVFIRRTWQVGKKLKSDLPYLQEGEVGLRAARRSIVNEAEVLRAMHQALRRWTERSNSAVRPKLRFHVDHNNVSFGDQVRLFAHSSLLVGVVGAGLSNMLFMPPRSVVMVLQPVGMREDFAAMAAGCGHYAVPFFVECQVEVVRLTKFRFKPSARLCGEDTDCKNRVNNLCHVRVDIPAFKASFSSALSYALYGAEPLPEVDDNSNDHNNNNNNENNNDSTDGQVHSPSSRGAMPPRRRLTVL